MLYYIILYYILYCIVLYCIILFYIKYYTVLYNIIYVVSCTSGCPHCPQSPVTPLNKTLEVWIQIQDCQPKWSKKLS